MFTLVLSDAKIPNESLARSEYVHYEQKILLNQTYGGPGFDYAFTLIQTADRGFALAGATNSYGAGKSDMWLLGRYDIWLVKTDANGVAQWNQTYGGTESDGASALIQTADRGFALAGVTNSYGAGESDMWLVKTDANGVAQWNQTFGGTGSDVTRALIQTTDGGFALAGFTKSYGAGNYDMWLVKTDANGVALWNQTFGGIGSDGASALIQTADGGLALAGNTESYGAGESDMWLVKTDANGVAQWNQTYGGTESDSASALIQTADRGFVLAGVTNSYGAGESDMWLVKTDANGVAQWNQTFGGMGSDSASALIQTTNGGLALAGSIESYGAGKSDMWLVKTDANGVAQWNQTFGGREIDGTYSIIQTSDRGFVLTGSTESYGAGQSDMWLVKIKPTSTLEALIAPFLNLIGLIFFFITFFLLIIVIRKQKRG
ncbi:MAG: hypothetical protein ACXADY_17165 [Candidatus Hodarchaeales archaeon]|jgi:hypothetical protein